MRENLLAPDPIRLPEDGPDAAAMQALEADQDPLQVAANHPTSPLAWAQASRDEMSAGRTVAGYAMARTGYHRSLDMLRKNGWRGQGPVPASHTPNRGVLLAVMALIDAAEAIGEDDEVTRLGDLLDDFDPQASAILS